jgi:phage FluMu gp28-like protein
MTQLEVGARPYYESCKDECGRDIYKLYLQFTDKWKDFGVNFKKSEKISFQKRAGGDFDENEVMGFGLEPIVFYKRQFEIFFGNHKLGLLEGSTKSGKTFAALWWIVYQALSISGKDRNVFIWAAPTQDQANITYNDLQNMYLSEIEDAGYCKFTQDPHPHITFCNGAIIKFVPASPANLMGNGVVAIVIDEASLCEKGIWTTINSITFQTEGLIRMLGNVISYGNWWNKICRDPVIKRNPRIKYDKLTIYEALEGGVITKEAVDFVRDMHRNEPSEFDRLYLCEPGEDGGNPFNQQKIEKITMPFLANGVPVAFGVDVAKSRDYTVIIGLNKECEVCYYRRFNKENWDTTNEIIIQSVGKEIYTCLDTTGVGSQTRDYIKDKVNLIDFNFTQRAKQELISDLIYVVHREN